MPVSGRTDAGLTRSRTRCGSRRTRCSTRRVYAQLPGPRDSTVCPDIGWCPTRPFKLDGMGFADHDQPGGDQALGECGGVARYPVSPHFRAACRYPSFDLDQVLERNWNPVQRPDHMSRADGFVCRLGGKPRLLGINLHKGVELTIPGTNLLEQRVDQIDRRKTASTDLRQK